MVIVVAIAVMFNAFGALVAPRITNYMTRRIPGAIEIQTVLQKRFPNSSFSFSDQTTYGSKKQHVLIVSISGRDFLSDQQETEAKSAICSVLGENTQPYTSITLQNVDAHQFLMFYYNKSQSESFTCPQWGKAN